MSRTKLRVLGLFFGAIAFLIVLGPAYAEVESKRVAVTAVADRMTSPSYAMSVTSVPIAGVAGVCPSGSVTSLGFWSVLGSMEVPVRLMVQKNAINPGEVDLSWSGQSSLFEIYRSSSPDGLVSPTNLYRTTTICDETDDDAEAANILFFKIIIPPTTEQ